MRRTWLVLALAGAGCRSILGFDDPKLAGTPDGPEPDAAVAPDAPLPCIADGIDFSTVELGDLQFAASETIDTDTDARCVAVAPGIAGCVLAGDHVTIDSGVELAVIGSRPLVVFACGSLAVSGTIDVSSTANRRGAAGNDASCPAAAVAGSDSGGAGGGAGGSFGGDGGDGGNGDTNDSLAPPGPGLGAVASPAIAPPTTPRGGCPGGVGGDEDQQGAEGDGGLGGDSGGAVWLVSVGPFTLPAGGGVLANGAGGRGGEAQAGGGGGGSGGWIRIFARSIAIDGVVAANGGGGGGGGARIGGFPTSGTPGQHGQPSSVPANGGVGATGAGAPQGTGGTGAAGSAPAEDGVASEVGAGGGGGGAGAITLVGPTTITGTVSPAAP